MSNKTYHPRKTMGLLVCFFLSILIPCGLMAQNFSYYNQIKQINEYGAAPTKASMAYSLDSPVNKLTGAACFDIPIYTIKAGNSSKKEHFPAFFMFLPGILPKFLGLL